MYLFWTLLVTCLTSGQSVAADPVLANITSPDSVGNIVDSNSSITWADIPRGTAYKASDDYSDGGMGLLFDFARSFINTCLPNVFPYDLIEKVMQGNLDIMTEAHGLVMDFLGYAVAIVTGLLFVIIFPIVGCCFCCCRCCGNCGGKRMQKPSASASCKRKVFSTILLSMVIMSSVGMVCVFVSNDRLTSALTKIVDTAVDNIDDVSTFLNNTFEQVQHVVEYNFNFTKNVVFRDLDSLGYLVGIPVRSALDTSGGISTALNGALALQSVLDIATNDLYTVFSEIQYLTDNVTQMTTELEDVKMKIDAACVAPCYTDTSGLQVGFDNSQIPNISSQKSQLDTLQAQNLSQTILEAQSDFEAIPERVQNETATTVDALKTQVDDYSSTVETMIIMIENLRIQAHGSFDIDSTQSLLQDTAEDISIYDKYRWYAGIGLTCVVLLVVLLLFLGLTCGACGSSASDMPDKRGCLSNCGGNLLMASVGFIFTISWLLMLLTTVTFMIGAPAERFVCQPLSDPQLKVLTKVIDDLGLFGSANGSFLGNMLFQDPSVDLTIAGVLKDCKNGKAAYTAFKLSNFKDFNLTALVDYKSKIDIDGQLDSINVDMSTVNILTPDMLNQLEDFKSAVTGINFTKFDELNRGTTEVNLTAKAQELRSLAPGNPSIAANMSEAADDLDNIQYGSYADTDTAKNNLKNSSNSLAMTFAAIPDAIDNVINKLNKTQQFIQNNGSDRIKMETVILANRLRSIVDTFTSDALEALMNEIGVCTPIYNIYASMIINGFCRYTLDALNGFWFSLGWCIFFFIPSVIFAVKLSKHYRRMERPDIFDSAIRVSSTSGLSFGKNKVGHADRW